MSIAHGAQHASPTILLPLEDADGEGLGEGLEYIGERLTVLAVAARIMVRRHPGDVYARSIARETLRLAGAMREALHTEDATRGAPHTPAPIIVDAAPTPLTPPATPETPATPATRHRARGSARASSSSKTTPATPARKGGAV